MKSSQNGCKKFQMINMHSDVERVPRTWSLGVWGSPPFQGIQKAANIPRKLFLGVLSRFVVNYRD